MTLIYSRALTPPGYKPEYHIGVRNSSNKMLLGFITGTPQIVNIRGKTVEMVDVDLFLYSD